MYRAKAPSILQIDKNVIKLKKKGVLTSSLFHNIQNENCTTTLMEMPLP